MEFILTPIISNNPEVIVRHEDRELHFPVRSIINRRLREQIKEDQVFYILNQYLKYKGKDFQDKLFEAMEKAYRIIENEVFKNDLEPLPIQAFHGILDVFELQDVIDFINKTKIVTPPSRLGDVFDENIEKNEKGTRIQTYLKSDYIELIALLTILKTLFGPIGQYTAIKAELLNKNPYKEYILLQLIITHPIAQSAPFQKVYLSIAKLVERVMSDDVKSVIRIIEKNISKSSIPDYILGKVLVERLFLNNELEDSNNKSTITKIYKYASNQLKSKSDTSTIKLKNYNQGGEDSESESNLETLRTPTSTTIGNITEFRVYASLPHKVLEDMGLGDHKEEFDKLVQIFRPEFEKFIPLQESIYITAWIVKHVMDPRGLFYLKLDELINLLTIAYIWLKKHEFYDLACIVVSYQKHESGLTTANNFVGKIDPYLKERLKEYYPYNRTVVTSGSNKEESFIENVITKIFKNLSAFSLRTLAEEEVVKKVNKGVYSPDYLLPSDIKNQLIRLLIVLAEQDEERFRARKLKSKSN